MDLRVGAAAVGVGVPRLTASLACLRMFLPDASVQFD